MSSFFTDSDEITFGKSQSSSSSLPHSSTPSPELTPARVERTRLSQEKSYTEASPSTHHSPEREMVSLPTTPSPARTNFFDRWFAKKDPLETPPTHDQHDRQKSVGNESRPTKKESLKESSPSWESGARSRDEERKSHNPPRPEGNRESPHKKRDLPSVSTRPSPETLRSWVSHDRGQKPEKSSLSPLLSLIHSMKKTYLSEDTSPRGSRLILLSSAEVRDPMYLIRSWGESLLIGSGFAHTASWGRAYPTFPDIRLVVSEQSRLSGWILTDSEIDLEPLVQILEALDFPQIFAPRLLLDRIREHFSSHPSVSRLRLHELASTSLEIGSLHLSRSSIVLSDGSLFALTPEQRGYRLDLSSVPMIVTPDESRVEIQPGEIVILEDGQIQKEDFRFTLDRFYLDRETVGVLAGYTLRDREELANSWVLTFLVEEDHAHRAIISHIYIDSRGFVHAHEMMRIHKEILKSIRSSYESTVLTQPDIDRAGLVAVFRREIARQCRTLVGRAPVIIPIVIER